MAKPIKTAISHKIDFDEFITAKSEYHFDINTKDSGIPEIKNTNIVSKYLSNLFVILHKSIFLRLYRLHFSPNLFVKPSKHTFKIVCDVIDRTIATIIILSGRYVIQNAKNDVCANANDMTNFKK